MIKAEYADLNISMQESVGGTISSGFSHLSVTDSSLLIKNNIPANYISFDGNGIDLNDRSKFFYKSGDYAGFISENVSSESKKLSNIQISLTLDSGTFDFTDGITISFYGNCCTKFTAKYTSSETINEFEELTVDSELFYWKPSPSHEITEIQLIFTDTCLPNQFLKINYIKFGKITVFDQIRNIELLEETNILSDDLPMNSFNFSIAASGNIKLKSESPINAYSNGRYYGTFYLDSAERTSESTHQIKCFNSVNVLENTEMPGFGLSMEPSTLAGSLEYLSHVTGLRFSSVPDISKYYFLGDIGIVSLRYFLCGIAFACGMMVDSSRNDGANLIKIPTEISSVILSDRIIGSATFSKSKKITGATWRYPLFYDAVDKTISPGVNSGVRTKIVFEKPMLIDVYSSDITLHDYSSYFIDFTPNKDNIVLSAQELEFYKKEVSISNPDATEKDKNNTLKYDKFSILGMRDPEVEGEAFENIDKSVDILKYMKSTGTVKAKIRLRGEHTGDLVKIETAYDGMITGIIKSMNVHFGYEDTADIEVLEWQAG